MNALFLVLILGTALNLAQSVCAAEPEPLKLANEGQARRLPDQILGVTESALTEHLLDEPAKIAAYKAVGPAYLRFPGGSYANFYNWRTGQVEIQSRPESSDYVKFWARLAEKIKRSFPKGISFEDYLPLARAQNADVVLVVNLETSGVEEQTAWFKSLAAKHILPKHIELGNEFWVAMANDPDSLCYSSPAGSTTTTTARSPRSRSSARKAKSTSQT